MIDAILVLSCDNYVDTHYHFESTFNKYATGFRVPLIFVTESRKDERVLSKYIYTGRENSCWGYMVRKAIENGNLHDSTVLFTFDDLFLDKELNWSCLVNTIKNSSQYEWSSLKIYARPRGVSLSDNFNLLPQGYPYQNTLVWTIWKCPDLLGLLKDEMSPWDFEKLSVKGKKKLLNIVVKSSLVKFRNTIVKGKKVWKYRAIEMEFGKNETREYATFQFHLIRLFRIPLFRISQFLKHVLFVYRSR